MKQGDESQASMAVHFTAAGLIIIFPDADHVMGGTAVSALGGMPVQAVTAVQAHQALASLRVPWRASPQGGGAQSAGGGAASGGVALCRPAQTRDWLQGNRKARALPCAPTPGAYGEDPRLDKRLGARRRWCAHALGCYRVAPVSGAPVVSYSTSERKLSEKERVLQFQLDAVLQRKADKPGKCIPSPPPASPLTYRMLSPGRIAI